MNNIDRNLSNRNDANVSEVISRKYRILFQQFSKRSKLEKRLILLLVLGASSFSVTTLLIVYLSVKYNLNQTICTKPECILAAARLLEGMNMSADPCEDFYEYVCGMWDKTHENSPNEANSWFIERTKFLNNKIKSILEEEIRDSDLKPVEQMKKFYRLCMDTGALNRKGLHPLFQVLILLELPQVVPNTETVDSFNLSKTLALAQRTLNLDVLIQLSTFYDNALNTTLLSVSPASTENSFSTSQKGNAKLITPEEYMVHQITYMTAVMIEFGATSTTIDDISRIALKLLLLEAQFRLNTENESPSRFFTIQDLQAYMFPNATEIDLLLFSWQEFLSVLTTGMNVSLEKDDIIYVVNPFYFQSLGNLLINLQPINFLSSSERYIWWKIVDALVIHTTDLMRSHKYIFNEYVYDGVPKPTRSSVCIFQTKSVFKEAISHVIATREKSSNVSEKILVIMSDIKEIFKRIIANSDWIDDNTKEMNILKADSIKVYVGYPYEIFQPGWILKLYQKVTVSGDFISAVLSIRSEQAKGILSTLHTSLGRYNNINWSVDPTDVNAYYSRDTNSIVIPFGILQYPFYSNGLQALNYGAIGSILGHELTHGFDNEGKDYDSFGNKKVTWNEETIAAYNNRTKCFINQYRQYKIFENITVDGNLTLAENIADNGGIKETFYAYKEFVARNGDENILPAFEKFSHLQLLFISFANVWCKKHSDLSLQLSAIDEHSPNRFRVIGSLSNLPEFSTTWNCAADSKMNSPKKCLLW